MEITRRSAGRFKTRKRIAPGILEVWDEALQRPLAMKRGKAGDRLLHEARILGRLDHPGIVKLHETGLDEDGGLYYTMPLKEGRSLEDVLSATRIEIPRILTLLLRTCEAMVHAHARGVIHGNLSPVTIRVGRFNEACIMGWGSARVRQENTRVDEDIIRIGAILRRLLECDRREKEDHELAAVAEKAVTGIYSTMEGLVDDLRDYLEGRVVRSLGTGALLELKKWILRNKRLALTVILLVAFALAGLGLTSVVRARSNHQLEQSNRELESAEMLLQEEQARAEQKKREVLRLTDLKRIEKLITRAATLWPPHPDRIIAHEQWLDEANQLKDKLDGHCALLDEIRARARPWTAAEIEAAERSARNEEALGELDRRINAKLADSAEANQDGPNLSYYGELDVLLDEMDALKIEERFSLERVFDRTEDEWQHAIQALLVDRLTEFCDPEEGCMAGVQARLDFARTVEERTLTGPEAATAWDEALAAIADTAASPFYGGLRMKPQLGLIPIGRDPDSGFFEFAHLQTGEPPQRSPETGRLLITPESAVVLVLLPGGIFTLGAQSADPHGTHYDPLTECDECPLCEIHLDPYFCSKYEMTQGQWLRACGENPSRVTTALTHPVECVTWMDCTRVLQCLDLSLPTEAQWEFAARGGDIHPLVDRLDP